MESFSLIAVLMMGLASSFHCVGMCAPLAGCATSVCPSRNKGFFVLQTGRLISYTVIGGLIGLGGSAVNGIIESGAVIRISAIISIALVLLSVFVNIKLGFAEKFAAPLMDMIGRGKNAYFGNFLLGIVTGFLPCGALYPAYAVSLAAGNAFLGAAGMSLFFLGTLPGNSVIFLSYNILKRKLSTGQLKMIYLVLGVVGISSLYVKIGDPAKAKTCHTPGTEHHEKHSGHTDGKIQHDHH